MRYGEGLLEEIRRRTDLVQLVGRRVKLVRKGGDASRWLIETEGLSFPESVEKLAAEAGVELPKWSPEDEAREQQRKSLYDLVELAAKFYEAQLFEGAGREAREYLRGRGLDGAAAKQFRLGYAPSGGQTLIAHL